MYRKQDKLSIKQRQIEINTNRKAAKQTHKKTRLGRQRARKEGQEIYL